jgi:hypothetical protein
MANFFEMIYEGFPPLNFFYINEFSNAMYEADAYTSIGLIMLFSSLVMEILYYYMLSNYGNLHKRSYWFLWLITIAIVNFIVAYMSSMSALDKSEPDNTYTFSRYFTFSMVNVLWAIIFSFVFSLIFKTKSISASRTPF